MLNFIELIEPLPAPLVSTFIYYSISDRRHLHTTSPVTDTEEYMTVLKIQIAD